MSCLSFLTLTTPGLALTLVVKLVLLPRGERQLLCGELIILFRSSNHSSRSLLAFSPLVIAFAVSMKGLPISIKFNSSSLLLLLLLLLLFPLSSSRFRSRSSASTCASKKPSRTLLICGLPRLNTLAHSSMESIRSTSLSATSSSPLILFDAPLFTMTPTISLANLAMKTCTCLTL